MDFRELCNFEEGREMSLTKSIEAKRDELVQSARLLGENLSRCAFGERGPDWNVTLTAVVQDGLVGRVEQPAGHPTRLPARRWSQEQSG